MTTYIFQGNPDLFDIEGYLALRRERINWLVNQSYREIDIGDQVFIWKARGTGRYGPAGILAECLVDSKVLEIPEDEFAIPFWRGEQDHNALRRRVWLLVIRVAETGRILDRDTVRIAPGLQGRSVLRSVTGDLGFPRAEMSKSIRDNPNRRLSHAGVAIGDFALDPRPSSRGRQAVRFGDGVAIFDLGNGRRRQLLPANA